MKYEELLIQTDQRDDWIPEETYLQEEKKAGVFDNLFGKNKSIQEQVEGVKTGNDVVSFLKSRSQVRENSSNLQPRNDLPMTAKKRSSDKNCNIF